MRRKSLIKCLLWLVGACVVALGYVFYTFHNKQRFEKTTSEENEVKKNIPILFSKQTILDVSSISQTLAEVPTSFQPPTEVPTTSQDPAEVPTGSQPSTEVPTTSQTPAQESLRRSLLIFGHDRSGTTFISAMFSSDPQIFMVYEPLWITETWKYYEREYNCSKCELQVVSSILACNFTRSPVSTKFLSYVSTPWTGALPINIFKTPHFCHKSEEPENEVDCPKLDKNPEFVDNVCLTKFKHSVIKVGPPRISGEKLAELVPQVLLENPDIDIRVLHIVRDPRGNINSRIDINWTKDYPSPSLPYTARKLCDSILSNLDHADKTLTELKLKHRYKLVTYKQIADDPLGTAKDIYNFAGFEMPVETEKWMVETTTPSEKKLKEALQQPYSTVRKARGNADKWRQDAFFQRNRVIEKQCKPLMDKLGLESVSKPEGSSSGDDM